MACVSALLLAGCDTGETARGYAIAHGYRDVIVRYTDVRPIQKAKAEFVRQCLERRA